MKGEPRLQMVHGTKYAHREKTKSQSSQLSSENVRDDSLDMSFIFSQQQ